MTVEVPRAIRDAMKRAAEAEPHFTRAHDLLAKDLERAHDERQRDALAAELRALDLIVQKTHGAARAILDRWRAGNATAEDVARAYVTLAEVVEALAAARVGEES